MEAGDSSGDETEECRTPMTTATPITPNRTPNKSGFELFAKVRNSRLYKKKMNNS